MDVTCLQSTIRTFCDSYCLLYFITNLSLHPLIHGLGSRNLIFSLSAFPTFQLWSPVSSPIHIYSSLLNCLPIISARVCDNWHLLMFIGYLVFSSFWCYSVYLFCYISFTIYHPSLVTPSILLFWYFFFHKSLFLYLLFMIPALCRNWQITIELLSQTYLSSPCYFQEMVMARKSRKRKILKNRKTQMKTRKTWMKTRKILKKIWKMMRKTSYWPLKWIALFLISDASLIHQRKSCIYINRETLQGSHWRERERDPY